VRGWVREYGARDTERINEPACKALYHVTLTPIIFYSRALPSVHYLHLRCEVHVLQHAMRTAPALCCGGTARSTGPDAEWRDPDSTVVQPYLDEYVEAHRQREDALGMQAEDINVTGTAAAAPAPMTKRGKRKKTSK
jgi:hypothetical protein